MSWHSVFLGHSDAKNRWGCSTLWMLLPDTANMDLMGWEFGDTPASRIHVLLSLQESTTLSVAIILLLFFSLYFSIMLHGSFWKEQQRLGSKASEHHSGSFEGWCRVKRQTLLYGYTRSIHSSMNPLVHNPPPSYIQVHVEIPSDNSRLLWGNKNYNSKLPKKIYWEHLDKHNDFPKYDILHNILHTITQVLK